MRNRAILVMFGLLAVVLLSGVAAAQRGADFLPGGRVLLDAHNAYPYQGRWENRLDRALSTGAPLAVEQDLLWRPARNGADGYSIVSHGEPFTGQEPTLGDFFERMRPLVTRALAEDSRARWPLVTVNLDFKDSLPEHFDTIWRALGKYEEWLTTAPRVEDVSSVEPLTIRPVLVLTGADPAQQVAFHDRIPPGARLRLFGAVNASNSRATNYLRWSNNAWSAVEPEGQPGAGEWTQREAQQLKALVDAAHAAGLWIRFYTLNGQSPQESDRQGWSPGYNFSSVEAVRTRWRAAVEAGVDFVATDQYEDFSALLHDARTPTR